MIEMPTYRLPLLKNVGYTVIEKTKSFVLGAGKIILAISIVLWFLGSNGYSDDFQNAESIVAERIENEGLSTYSKNYVQNNIDAYRTNAEAEGMAAGAIQDSIQMLREELSERAVAQ